MEDRDGQKKAIGLGLVAVAVLALLYFGAAAFQVNQFSSNSVGDGLSCSTRAKIFQNDAETMMVNYLLAHNQNDAETKFRLRSRTRDLDEPSCVDGAKDAMLDWYDAVDVDDQPSKNAADNAFLDAFE